MIRAGREARRAAACLCLVDFPGTEPSARLERLVADCGIAGVVLFRKNVASAQQVAGLTAALQRIARGAGAPPVWVAIDHEGGAVNRFLAATSGAGPAVTSLPSAMALGAAGDPALARLAGRVAGHELRALGVHLNFAPVMDVNNNPANPVIGARAFGELPSAVEALGVAYIEGLQSAGVGATAKHFPGHGDVTVDSHLALPRVEHGTGRLETVELAPFAAAARAGVAAVMTAHILFPALDPAVVPATMSGPILRGILRERWGYHGLVCSDSLSMRAIVNHYSVGDAAVAAVGAGCDLLLALGPEALQDEVLDHLAAAIERGVIPPARVAETLTRLDAAAVRWRVGTDADAVVEQTVGTEEHRRAAVRIAEAAVTLVRDLAGALPVQGGRLGVVTLTSGSGESGSPDFGRTLEDQGADARRIAAGGPFDTFDRVIVATSARGLLPSAQASAIRDLHRSLGDRLIVISTGDPYDLLQYPQVPAFLATYGPDGSSLDAAAGVLLGRIAPRGRLPVTLPGLHPAGHAWG